MAASEQPLNRDVWYMATADEEAGGFFGAGWLVENRPDLFADVGYLLNEGGSGRRFEQGVAVMVEVTQKSASVFAVDRLRRPDMVQRPRSPPR